LRPASKTRKMPLLRKDTLDPTKSEKEKIDELNSIVNKAWNKAEEIKEEKEKGKKKAEINREKHKGEKKPRWNERTTSWKQVEFDNMANLIESAWNQVEEEKKSPRKNSDLHSTAGLSKIEEELNNSRAKLRKSSRSQRGSACKLRMSGEGSPLKQFMHPTASA